jgi:uncharacterized protein (DUF1330 family)
MPRKAYLIAAYRKIRDPEALAAYGKLAGPAMRAAGGRILALGVAAQSYEAGLSERTVLIEFPDLETARAAYGSPAYQEAYRLLNNAAERDLRIVEAAE